MKSTNEARRDFIRNTWAWRTYYDGRASLNAHTLDSCMRDMDRSEYHGTAKRCTVLGPGGFRRDYRRDEAGEWVLCEPCCAENALSVTSGLHSGDDCGAE